MTERRLCCVGDAGGLIHWGMVGLTRAARGGVVNAVSVTLECTATTARWDYHGVSPDTRPRGWSDLPKIMHGDVMLVSYAPRHLTSPPVTCVRCAVWNPSEDSERIYGSLP